MYKILIIEDEPVGAERLRKLILKIDDSISISGPLRTVNDVKAALKINNDYDLIISDIRLGGDVVFEAFKETFPYSFVIFTTAFDEYAIQAFKNNGIDYLLKPIDPNELETAIDKAKRLSMKDEQVTGLKDLIHEGRFNIQHHLLIPKGDELILIDTDEISYIFKGADVKAYLFNGERACLPYSLGELESMLEPNIFFRLNRQYIANRKSIKRISMLYKSKLKVKLINCQDETIMISKERTSQFKRWLEQ